MAKRMHYVTAIAVPATFAGTLEDLRARSRTDMGKFFTSSDAKMYASQLRGASFFDIRVEERDE